MRAFRAHVIRWFAGATAIAGVALGARSFVAPAAHRRAASSPRGAQANGRLIDSLAFRSRQAVIGDPERAVALAYAERARLGLGNATRLADLATRDQRMGWTLRMRLADALLLQAEAGRSPDVASLVAASGDQATLEAVTRAMQRDPRAGTTPVRAALLLGASARAIPRDVARMGIFISSLEGDRVASRADALALREDAGRSHSDPLALLAARRLAGTLASEQPAVEGRASMASLASPGSAAALVDSLAVAVEGAAPRRAPLALRLGEADAAVLLESALRLPPQAAVVITQRTWEMAGRARSIDEIAARAPNEEAVIARWALHGSLDAQAAQFSVELASALRPWAQEPAMLPGQVGPTADSLRVAWGLASVRFDASIPERWRPWYRAQLDRALRDFARVFPDARFAGLNVNFRAHAISDSALALHDPRTRTLELPIATASGALAHELMHDLDWQLARRRDGALASGYASDAGVALGGRLSAALRAAGVEPAPTPATGAAAPRRARPAEALARGGDWLVSSVLARSGVSDAMLSGVQDALVLGHAGAVPGLGRGGTSLLVESVDALAHLPRLTREVMLREASDRGAASPMLALRSALQRPIDRRAVNRILGDSVLLAPLLRNARGDAGSPLALAAGARAEGWMRAQAASTAWSSRGAWAHGVLGDAPWSAALAGQRRAMLSSSLELAMRWQEGSLVP
ncbi:MAG: hypothetical protein JWO05_3407 [Gemmatimonadetes bacterium]|nr:hypothetical protein [Gemmatimonadota bacterium]